MLEWTEKKLTHAGIKYTVHNRGAHIKIDNDTHVFPTTGKFIFKGETHEPEWRDKSNMKRNIRKFIKLKNADFVMPVAPNNWSSGTAVPYQVIFMFPDGTEEFVKTEWKEIL